MNYERAKRKVRAKIALKTIPDRGEDDQPYSLNCKGWRLTDGKEYPVTVTRIPTKEKDDA